MTSTPPSPGLGSLAAAALVGGVAWTAAEYGLHRFAMHEVRGKGLASKEHLSHHADVTYFSPTSKKLLSAASTGSVVLPIAWATIGKHRALAFTAGMLTAYAGYEVAHRRTHTHPPTNTFGRWMRKSHFHHHFGAPMRNFGVTSPVWDVLLGTYEPPEIVTLPRRMAPNWMLDKNGEVKAEYQADYRAKGRRATNPNERARDRVDAFTNVTPLLTDDLLTDDLRTDAELADDLLTKRRHAAEAVEGPMTAETPIPVSP